MSDLVHNFAVRKRKSDASFKRVDDAIPEVARGDGSDVQAIVISGSLGKHHLGGVRGGLSDPCSDPGDPSSRAGFWSAREA